MEWFSKIFFKCISAKFLFKSGIENNRVAFLEKALEKKFDIDTPFQKETSWRYLKTPGSLRIICDYDIQTPLHQSIQFCAMDALRWLLNHQASIETANSQGQLPLELAVFRYSSNIKPNTLPKDNKNNLFLNMAWEIWQALQGKPKNILRWHDAELEKLWEQEIEPYFFSEKQRELLQESLPKANISVKKAKRL